MRRLLVCVVLVTALVVPVAPAGASAGSCWPSVPATLTPAQQATRAQVLRYLPPVFVRIAYRESRLTMTAHHRNRNGTIDNGPVQINSVHAARMRAMGLSWTNPVHTLIYAAWLYRHYGMAPWRCR